MTEIKLAGILKDMYEGAPYGEQVAHIHLFGIMFADEIILNGYRTGDIIKKSGLNASYATELSKGIKLAKYVTVK